MKRRLAGVFKGEDSAGCRGRRVAPPPRCSSSFGRPVGSSGMVDCSCVGQRRCLGRRHRNNGWRVVCCSLSMRPGRSPATPSCQAARRQWSRSGKVAGTRGASPLYRPPSDECQRRHSITNVALNLSASQAVRRKGIHGRNHPNVLTREVIAPGETVKAEPIFFDAGDHPEDVVISASARWTDIHGIIWERGTSARDAEDDRLRISSTVHRLLTVAGRVPRRWCALLTPHCYSQSGPTRRSWELGVMGVRL